MIKNKELSRIGFYPVTVITEDDNTYVYSHCSDDVIAMVYSDKDRTSIQFVCVVDGYELKSKIVKFGNVEHMYEEYFKRVEALREVC